MQQSYIQHSVIAKFIAAFIFIGSGLIFNSCKKYPENRLWFTKPENIFRGGKITSFTVDGADSIPLVNSTWGYDVTAKTFTLSKPYHDNSWWEAEGTLVGQVVFHGDKEVSMFLYHDFPITPLLPPYNPFLMQKESDGKTDNRWEILKCTRKNRTLKLQRKAYGKTYVVQFN